MLLALLMMISTAGAAMAASVSYRDGKVTVSQQDGIYMILIDGESTGKWVGSGMPSVTFDYPLDEGREHTLVLLSLAGDGNIGAMESFWAGPTPEPTAVPTAEPTPEPTEAPTEEPTEEPIEEPTEEPSPEPTEEPTEAPTEEPTPEPTPEIKGPVKIDSAFYEDRTLTLAVSGLRGYAEIWVDGQNTGLIVNENGVYTLNKRLPMGNHTVSLYVPAYNEIAAADFFAPFSPDPEITDTEALGALLKNDGGAAIPYRLAYTADENGAVMNLSAAEENAVTGGLNLYLSEDTLKKLRNNSVSRVNLTYGSAQLDIQLDKISASLFATDKAIWYYVFSISLTTLEGLYRVNLAAQTSVTDLMDAGYYSGVTLIWNENKTPVIINGLY